MIFENKEGFQREYSREMRQYSQRIENGRKAVAMNGNHYGVKHDSPAITGKVPRQYPWLSGDRHCDVCVTGGGMTGAMCVLFAAEMGLSAVLITSDGLGLGDTGHMPGCAEYNAGRTLTGLDRTMSTDDALALYSIGFEALDDLQNLCAGLDGAYRKSGLASGFARRDSLLYTADPTLSELMEREFLAVRKAFPDTTLITRRTAESAFAFDMCAGILTRDGSAVFDPYAFTHLCAMKAQELGAEIFEQTRALDIQTPKSKGGSVMITTSTHRTVYADRLIFAAGSEGFRAMFRGARKYSACCSVRKLSEEESGWSGRCSLRTFGRRSVSCCISPGGMVWADSVHREGLSAVAGKVSEPAEFSRLKNQVAALLPRAEINRPEYKYSHAFAAPRDGLPVIGAHEEFKNCFFALPVSVSGACAPVCSVVAARSAAAYLEGNNAPVFRHFDPMRL